MQLIYFLLITVYSFVSYETATMCRLLDKLFKAHRANLAGSI